MTDPRTSSQPHASAPPGSPFRHRAFTVIWIATVVSNIGGWMYSVASGWLMTSLDPNPFIVSLVQVANSLPMFLFAIPAGALADIVNQRRFLIIGESTITVVSSAFAALVWLHLVGPVSLLVFGFIVTVGSAMTAPAWQSVVGQLVPKSDLPSAVAANPRPSPSATGPMPRWASTGPRPPAASLTPNWRGPWRGPPRF